MCYDEVLLAIFVYFMSLMKPNYSKKQRGAMDRGLAQARKFEPGGAASLTRKIARSFVGVAKPVAKKGAKKVKNVVYDATSRRMAKGGFDKPGWYEKTKSW